LKFQIDLLLSSSGFNFQTPSFYHVSYILATTEHLITLIHARIKLNHSSQCRGKHQNNHRKLVSPPFTLGLEFSGTVQTKIPSSPFPVGTQVFGTVGHGPSIHYSRYTHRSQTLGTFATHISIHHSLLRPLPPSPYFTLHASSSLAATAPVSYGALITRVNLSPKETVLIHGASGGLGLYAVQIAKALGATVIGTASTSRKCEIVKSFGADACINYVQHKNWEQEVLKLTKGQGADVVFDSVGLVEQSLKCLKPKGRVLVIGFAGREGNLEKLPVNKILLKQASIIGYVFFNLLL
jgi:NADPH2:quinone reductase